MGDPRGSDSHSIHNKMRLSDMRIIYQGLSEHRTMTDSLQIREDSSKGAGVPASLEGEQLSLLQQSRCKIWKVWTR